MIGGIATMSELVAEIAEANTPALLECHASGHVAIFDESGFWSKPWHSDISQLISAEEIADRTWVYLLVVMANGDVQKVRMRYALFSKGGDA
jgi:hypothetical protein